MDPTVSVSKGVFVFRNGLTRKTRSKKKIIPEADNGNIFADELWFKSYNKLWINIEKKLQNLNNEMFASILSNLVHFIKTSYTNPVTEIPTATLLTGINMPDHAAQFSSLAKEVTNGVTPHVATLSSQDCSSLKNLVENMINQFINEETNSSGEEEEEVSSKTSKIRKSQCNFSLLQSWYENLYDTIDRVLVVIIPEFESFNEKVLQNFIQIVSSYINTLPFVLVFGVATSLTALHRAMPYHVLSKVHIQVFNSQPSATYLNNVLENVLFSKICPFNLGGKLFTFLTDVFLFYDFSVTGFIQNFKFVMLEHYSTGNAKALCTPPQNISEILKEFEHEDYENVRRLMSFRKFVEAEVPQNQIKLLTDDAYFKDVLEDLLINIFPYLYNMHIFIRCLQILVADLPKAPLGKHIREIYNLVVTKKISNCPEFKEAFQLLGFQSKDELEEKIKKVIKIVQKEEENDIFYVEEDLVSDLTKFIEEMNVVTMEVDEDENESNTCEVGGQMQRAQLKQKLLQMTKKSRPLNAYEKQRIKIVAYFEKMFAKYLPNPSEFPLYEIFFFNDLSIQNNIIGSHRAAIHSALNDPKSYLDCSCCGIPNDSAILSTMPDICIAYKLHLEYGKMINLYDWLQAFLSILDPVYADDEDAKKEVNPQLQARFTQCVAELEFLGFVKSSKRKTDHVARLTWGG